MSLKPDTNAIGPVKMDSLIFPSAHAGPGGKSSPKQRQRTGTWHGGSTAEYEVVIITREYEGAHHTEGRTACQAVRTFVLRTDRSSSTPPERCQTGSVKRKTGTVHVTGPLPFCVAAQKEITAVKILDSVDTR
jgi:hypothetical protein